jgi:HPt (histidine-containing phosphotransfer) domain-containing protein
MEMGVDVNGVLNRLGGNESLYLNICNKFIKDPNYQIFKDALSVYDYQSAELRIHTLKGVAANLGFVRLELISGSLLQDLREKQISSLRQDVSCLSEEYHRIINILSENQHTIV